MSPASETFPDGAVFAVVACVAAVMPTSVASSARLALDAQVSRQLGQHSRGVLRNVYDRSHFDADGL